jgi:hypothetical protein
VQLDRRQLKVRRNVRVANRERLVHRLALDHLGGQRAACVCVCVRVSICVRGCVGASVRAVGAAGLMEGTKTGVSERVENEHGRKGAGNHIQH